MKAHTASLINALVLITMSAWGYFSSETPSITALIPGFIGVVLLAMNGGIRKENKVIAHIAVVLTLLAFFGLIKPLMGDKAASDNMAMMRILLMMGSTVLALVFFVKSFMDARKKKDA